MSPHGMAVSNHRYLSNSETRVKKRQELHLPEATWRQLGIYCCHCIYFTKKVTSSVSTTQLRNWQFQTPRASMQYFQRHLLAFSVRFFGGEHQGFLKEGVKAY